MCPLKVSSPGISGHFQELIIILADYRQRVEREIPLQKATSVDKNFSLVKELFTRFDIFNLDLPLSRLVVPSCTYHAVL